MSDLIGFVEGLAAQLAAIGHGDSPMVRHALAAAERAKATAELQADFAALDADVLEAVGRLRAIEDAALRAMGATLPHVFMTGKADLMALLRRPGPREQVGGLWDAATEQVVRARAEQHRRDWELNRGAAKGGKR